MDPIPIARKLLSWIRARSRVVQLGLLLSAVVILPLVWWVLAPIVGFLVRRIAWRWIKAAIVHWFAGAVRRRLGG